MIKAVQRIINKFKYFHHFSRMQILQEERAHAAQYISEIDAEMRDINIKFKHL